MSSVDEKPQRVIPFPTISECDDEQYSAVLHTACCAQRRGLATVARRESTDEELADDPVATRTRIPPPSAPSGRLHQPPKLAVSDEPIATSTHSMHCHLASHPLPYLRASCSQSFGRLSLPGRCGECALTRHTDRWDVAKRCGPATMIFKIDTLHSYLY